MKTALAYPFVLGIVLSAIVSTCVIWIFLKDTNVDDWERLDAVISEFRLAPIQVRQFAVDDKYRLGQALFFDPVLSGPRSIACVSCHLFDHGTSDGLRKSVGVGGEGLGSRRSIRGRESEHRHNSLDLLNRDSQEVRNLFWDGRVEVLDPVKRVFRSPLGDALPAGFDNAMAVQAVLPILTPDEMLGFGGEISSSSLPEGHANQPNELAAGLSEQSFSERYAVVNKRLMFRLLGSAEPKTWQRRYRQLFEAAYPNERDFNLIHLANAIAHYEELAFATDSSEWDRYLEDRAPSLSLGAVKGALLFYGKGLCTVCHSGPLFSDFNFHSVGIFGSHLVEVSRQSDTGRAYATGEPIDMYKFRTPPLRNVTMTAPYFHDGSSISLEGAISRHLNPWSEADAYAEDGGLMLPAEHARVISPLFVDGPQLSSREIGYLVEFLGTLDFEPRPLSKIVPETVPSGLLVIYNASQEGDTVQ